jgi:exopolysaccharide production protein ExoZ
MEKSGSHEKLESIQVVRGIAAINVFLLHLVVSYFAFNGAFGVDIFFCVSGFIMMFVTQKNVHCFMRKRIIRIVPLYWLVITGYFFIIVIARTVIHYNVGDETGSVDALALIKSLLFLETTGTALVGRAWTLSYEMLFYLLFWVSCLISIKYRALICSIFITIVYMASNVFDFLPYDGLMFYEFIFGFALYYLLASTKNMEIKPTARVLFVMIAVLSMLLLYATDFSIHRLFVWGPLSFLFVLSFVFACKGYTPPRSWVLLGDMSYSIYLVHGPVLKVVKSLIIKFAGADYFWDDKGIKVLSETHFIVLYFIGGVAVTFAVSFLCYVLIEKRLTSFLRKKYCSE